MANVVLVFQEALYELLIQSGIVLLLSLGTDGQWDIGHRVEGVH